MTESKGHWLGETLVTAGVITAEQLEAGLALQVMRGGPLGRNLILSGACTRLELYRALAQSWGTEFVDLLEQPPRSELLALVDPVDCLEELWIPWRESGNQITVATSRNPQDVFPQISELFPGRSIHFVTTTDWDVTQVLMSMRREPLAFIAAESLATDNPEASAKRGIVRWQRLVLIIGLSLSLVAFVLNLPSSVVVIGMLANLLFTFAVGFKIMAAIAGGVYRADHTAVARNFEDLTGHSLDRRIADIELPMYTILVPVFNESNVVNLIIENLGCLDYPKTQLQVLILCEEEDALTIAAVKNARPPEYVRLLVVPEGLPKTKPRACNFGLLFATGEFLVIFDAEDRPDPDQLRKTLVEFELLDAIDDEIPTVCVQAALNYFNWDENLLTRLFTIEYSAWFDGMLPGLELIRMPIPLGGTSNHFRTDMLRTLGGWDPYNVTEDAELGMRASAAGFKVGTIYSTTWEEACSETTAWIRQRTRWIKGYLITGLVVMRHPLAFTRRAGIRSLATMLGLVIGSPLMFLAYPLVWAMTLATYVGLPLTEFTMSSWMSSFTIWNFLVGNVAMIAVGAVTGWRRQGWRLSLYAFLNPVYWFMHAFAAWRALFQLLKSPHVWEKTPHGLTHEREEVRTMF